MEIIYLEKSIRIPATTILSISNRLDIEIKLIARYTGQILIADYFEIKMPSVSKNSEYLAHILFD